MKIVILGSGNLAWHLGNILQKTGQSILQVYSPTEPHASQFANQLKTSYTTNLQKILPNADLYILAIADDAIYKVCKNPDLKQIIANKPCVHTAGSADMTALSKISENTGVFYPLQTFSKNKAVNFKEIPICLEANSENTMQLLKNIAKKISSNIHIITSEQRQQLHLAAVFACNFSNHFYALAEVILKPKNISFDLLKPLIKQTTNKALLSVSPKNSQTGPAIRKDFKTMEKHIASLSASPNLQELYKLVSNSISKIHEQK